MSDSFWNEVKKLFKTKQTIAEEEAQKVGEAIEKEKDVVQQLAELEKQYKENLPDDSTIDLDNLPKEISLDRIKYNPKSDADIRLEVENLLKENLVNGKKTIDEDTLNKVISLNEKQAKAQEDKSATLDEIEALFSKMKQSAEADSIKRGIQRSSIISEQLKDYDIAKAGSVDEVRTAYQNATSEIEKKLQSLQAEREDALEKLDLTHATQTTEKIAELTKERDKLQNEAVIKNNEIAKKESDYNLNVLKQRESMIADAKEQKEEDARKQAEYEKINGYSGEKQENYSKRYDIALDFYLTLDPDIAEKALDSSSNMKYYLGNYYDKLKGVLADRARHTNKY